MRAASVQQAMERKRKLPARAAARVEQVSKKRTATPPAERSLTPAAAPQSDPEPTPEAPQLPSSVAAGAALPTVESAQSDDLSSKEYQSIQERYDSSVKFLLLLLVAARCSHPSLFI